MATYTLTAGQVGKHAFNLAASTVDTVAFADDVRSVEIISDGSAAVYYTLDGSTPTVAGANTRILPAGSVSVATHGTSDTKGDGTTVKLISAGTPVVSVQKG